MVDISIIVPVYNAEKTISRLLDSILTQKTTLSYEVLLINDGSTDSTVEVIDSYLSSVVKLVSQPNQGVSSARNKGLELSNGEHVLFVDSDDFLADDCFSMLENHLNKADLLLFGFKHEGTTRVWEYPDGQRSTVSFLKDSNYIYHLSTPVGKLFKKEIIVKYCLLFDISLSYGEDSLFVYSYLAKSKDLFMFSDIFYLIDTSNENSLSRKPQMNTYQSMQKNLDLIKSEKLLDNHVFTALFLKWLRLVVFNELLLNTDRIVLKNYLREMLQRYKENLVKPRCLTLDGVLFRLLSHQHLGVVIFILKMRLQQLKMR